MTILSNFEKIIERYESLKRVCYIILPELPNDISAVKVEFSESTVFIVVNEDDDTLHAVPQLPHPLEGREHIDVSANCPWRNIVGKPVRWVWDLINNQGYLDGMQFEFTSDTRKGKATIIQMMGMASRISVRSVSEIHRVLPTR